MHELAIPEGKSLFPFQDKAIRQCLHFLNWRGAAYNACEQGLGKTIQSAAIINTLLSSPEQKIVIIAGASMLFKWASELRDWLTTPKEIGIVYDSKDLPRYLKKQPDILLISHSLLIRGSNALDIANQGADLLICDECHRLKNRKAKTSKAVLNLLWSSARLKLMLSGTPFRKSVTDGFSIFHKIAPDIFPDFYQFADRYCHRRVTPWAVEYHGVRNVEELSTLLRQNLLVRFLWREVFAEFPPVVYNTITIPAAYSTKIRIQQERKLLDEAEALRIALEGGSAPLAPSIHFQTHRHMQGMQKVKFVVEHAQSLIDDDIPVIIFAHHSEVIEAYETAFERYKPAVIRGGVSPKRRFQEVERFQTGKTKVFIANYLAGGEGITLTAGHRILLGEDVYNPAEIAQAIARANRIGQTKGVIATNFEVEKSIDRRIVKIAMEKAKAFAEVLG